MSNGKKIETWRYKADGDEVLVEVRMFRRGAGKRISFSAHNGPHELKFEKDDLNALRAEVDAHMMGFHPRAWDRWISLQVEFEDPKSDSFFCGDTAWARLAVSYKVIERTAVGKPEERHRCPREAADSYYVVPGKPPSGFNKPGRAYHLSRRELKEQARNDWTILIPHSEEKEAAIRVIMAKIKELHRKLVEFTQPKAIERFLEAALSGTTGPLLPAPPSETPTPRPRPAYTPKPNLRKPPPLRISNADRHPKP